MEAKCVQLATMAPRESARASITTRLQFSQDSEMGREPLELVPVIVSVHCHASPTVGLSSATACRFDAQPRRFSSLSHGSPVATVITIPVTGAEYRGKVVTPIDALAQFYHAFNQADLALMEANWMSGDDASMDNPLGGILRGWEEIQRVYSRVFQGRARVRVEFFDYSLHEADDFFYVVGRERGTATRDAQTLSLAIRTSRLYRRYAGVWRQVHHHGSIDSPALLESYQALVSAP